MLYGQLGGVVEPNREQCYLNANGEYVESTNEVRTLLLSLVRGSWDARAYWNTTILFYYGGYILIAIILLGRPLRQYLRSYKMLVMFFFFRHAFSKVPRPIAAKLRHMIGNCLNFIIQVQKFGGPPPKKIWRPKTCKISVDFIQPPTLIANISGTAQDI